MNDETDFPENSNKNQQRPELPEHIANMPVGDPMAYHNANEHKVDDVHHLNEASIIPPVITSKQKHVNPLLARAVLPGETVRLPSCGIFYTHGELEDDIVNGEIHIHPMTAIDEIVLTSAAKVYAGEAIVEVIARCIPSILKPYELLTQDIDFILLYLRKISYGPTVDFERVHEGCKAYSNQPNELGFVTPQKKQTFSASLPEILSKTIEVNKLTLLDDYKTELSNGQIVQLEPIRYQPFIEIIQALTSNNDLADNPAEQDTLLRRRLTNMIVSVDEVTDKDDIAEWLGVISPQNINEIQNKIESAAKWGVNADFQVKCGECGETMEVALPINPLALFS